MELFLRRLFTGRSFSPIGDKFESLEEVRSALRKAGLDNANLILGIDYTKSNEYTGERTFNGRCLHHISNDKKLLNPYQRVIKIVGETLEPFDEDKLIPVFGFGDSETTNKSDRSCFTFREVLQKYNEITPNIILSGPTNFAPLIAKAVEIVKSTNQYHILVIVADGQVVNEQQTRDAIVEASNYALSIITIGVGDGPWELQREFDDKLPERTFDNYQFVEFEEVISKNCANPESFFAIQALMEIPEQYKTIKGLGLLNKRQSEG